MINLTQSVTEFVKKDFEEYINKLNKVNEKDVISKLNNYYKSYDDFISYLLDEYVVDEDTLADVMFITHNYRPNKIAVENKIKEKYDADKNININKIKTINTLLQYYILSFHDDNRLHHEIKDRLELHRNSELNLDIAYSILCYYTVLEEEGLLLDDLGNIHHNSKYKNEIDELITKVYTECLEKTLKNISDNMKKSLIEILNEAGITSYTILEDIDVDYSIPTINHTLDWDHVWLDSRKNCSKKIKSYIFAKVDNKYTIGYTATNRYIFKVGELCTKYDAPHNKDAVYDYDVLNDFVKQFTEINKDDLIDILKKINAKIYTETLYLMPKTTNIEQGNNRRERQSKINKVISVFKEFNINNATGLNAKNNQEIFMVERKSVPTTKGRSIRYTFSSYKPIDISFCKNYILQDNILENINFVYNEPTIYLKIIRKIDD